MSLRQSPSNPIFLTSDQFSQIFNQSIRESQILIDLQQGSDTLRDMSFALPSNQGGLECSVNCTSSFLAESIEQKEPVILISQKKLEDQQKLQDQNQQLQESYQRILKQNKELLLKRKELEEENSNLIDENFQLKRFTQELQQKVLNCQNIMQLRRDQEIISLKQQMKDLQQKLRKEKDRESAPKNSQQSPSEMSTANSTKSHSQILIGYSTHRQGESSRNASRFTSPLPTKYFEINDLKGVISKQQ